MSNQKGPLLDIVMLSLNRLFVCILLIVPFLSLAQQPSPQDLELFKRYFCDSLTFVVDLHRVSVLNNKLEQKEKETIRESSCTKTYKRLDLGENLTFDYASVPNNAIPYGGLMVDDTPSVFDELDEIFCLVQGLLARPYSRPVKKGEKIFWSQYVGNREKREEEIKMQFKKRNRVKVERAILKRSLKAYKQQAKTLPLFYKIIDKVYGGDCDAYVDDLFSNSIFSNYDFLNIYKCYSLSSLRLRIDPLVVYSVCHALFLDNSKSENVASTSPLTLENHLNISSEKHLFKAYFIDSIRTKVDIITINQIYIKKTRDIQNEGIRTIQEDYQWGLWYPPRTWWTSFYADEYNFEKDYRTNDGKYLYLLDDMFYRLHLDYNEAEDKARMKRLITDFRLKAKRLPAFYECIDKKFHGNVDAYVNYLFDESYFVHVKRFCKLRKWPKSIRLSRDPLVKYSLSVMQYLYCD